MAGLIKLSSIEFFSPIFLSNLPNFPNSSCRTASLQTAWRVLFAELFLFYVCSSRFCCKVSVRVLTGFLNRKQQQHWKLRMVPNPLKDLLFLLKFNDEGDLFFVVRCCQTIMTTNSRSGTSSKKSLISLGQEKRGDLNLLMLNLSAGEMMGVVVGQISIEVILHISVRLLHL